MSLERSEYYYLPCSASADLATSAPEVRIGVNGAQRASSPESNEEIPARKPITTTGTPNTLPKSRDFARYLIDYDAYPADMNILIIDVHYHQEFVRLSGKDSSGDGRLYLYCVLWMKHLRVSPDNATQLSNRTNSWNQ